jgi:recombination protein RecA
MNPPYRQAQFEIVYGQGIDSFAELMELGNDYEVLRKYGKTITYDDTKYQMDEFQELLADNPEFKDAIVNDIMKKIKQTDVEEVVFEEPVVEQAPAIIETVQAEPTTIYEQLRQQALANNDLL